MKHRSFIPAAFALAATLAMTDAPALAASDTAELAQLSQAANTPKEHSEVARQYRAKAADMNAKAVKHEAEVKRLEVRRSPLDFKSPALSDRQIGKERQLAMEARRAAREASAQALNHTQLAVELMASR